VNIYLFLKNGNCAASTVVWEGRGGKKTHGLLYDLHYNQLISQPIKKLPNGLDLH
jgi:hypothetical protein